MQEPDMKSTEPESVPVLENFQENVELPAVAIRENAHPVGRTASASSFLCKQSTALRCLGFRLSVNFKLVDKWSQALRSLAKNNISLLSAILIFCLYRN